MDNERKVKVLLIALLGIIAAAIAYNTMGSPQIVKVDYWIDGDTVVIDGGTHVRLADIDAPEIDTPEGADAKIYIREHYPKGSILIMKIKETQKEGDIYGRTVAYLYPLMGESINNQLVQADYAQYDY